MIREIIELRKLLRNKKLSAGELRGLRDAKLRALIAHAFENVPYYQELFRSAGVVPDDIRTIDDLKQIPITSKEDLRNPGGRSFFAKGISPAVCRRMNTSGSTGIPLAVYLTPKELRIRQLLEFRSLLSVGFRPRDRLSVLGPIHPHASRLHQHLGCFRSENISTLISAEEQVHRLSTMRPTVLWAYPTALRALLHRAEDRLKNSIHPRIVITSAEGVDESLKDRIRAVWEDAEIFDFYGAVEFGRIAFECPEHRGLHVNADHLVVELTEDHSPAEFGKQGAAVITALNTRAMPLIRYRLGDIVSRIDGQCPCGSPFPLIGSVQGREEDMIRLPSGKLLSALGMKFVLLPFHGIDQFCVLQKNPGRLTIQLAVQEGFQHESISRIEAGFRQYLKEPVHIETQIVPFIERDGKFRSYINLNQAAGRSSQ